MAQIELNSLERSTLRSQAHALKPVVMMSESGLSENVLKEIDVSLSAHGLIKIRVAGDDREARSAIMQTVCEQLNAAPIQQIGKILVIWRPINKPPAPKRSRANAPHVPKKKAAVRNARRLARKREQ